MGLNKNKLNSARKFLITKVKKVPFKNSPRAILLVMAGLLVVIFILWLLFTKFSESTDDAYLKSDIIQISPKVSGYITEIGFVENQEVNAGQILLKIDDQDFIPRSIENAAGLEINRINLKKSLNNYYIQQLQTGKSKAAISAAKAELVRAEQEFKRAQALFKEEAISQEQLEAINTNYIRAKAFFQQASLDHKSSAQKQEFLLSEVVQNKEMIKQSLARLQESKNNLENTVIKSPTKGVIGNKNIALGSYVRAGNPLFSLVVTDSIYLEANFKETQIANLRPGQEVKITVDAIKDHEFKGRVASIAPASGAIFSLLPAENATGNFTKIIQRVPVKIEFDKNDPNFRRLIPGLSALVKVKIR